MDHDTDRLFPARANLPWLRDRTILLTRHGSHAYGLNTPTSDEDFKGVAVPPREYLLGFAHRFEQAESKTPDLVIYEVRKFFQLARDCNPNIIEVLWTDPGDHVVRTRAGDELIAERGLFLSRKVRHTFSGYAMAQLKRINTHHRWLVDSPKAPPRREDFGLRDASTAQRELVADAMTAIQREVAAWDELAWTGLDEAARADLRAKVAEHLARGHAARDDDAFVRAGRQLGYDDSVLELLERERQFRAAKQAWDAYQAWRTTRNKARAELETRFGYDTKHAMHLVRLLRMCREILETGAVVVKRPDRDELLAIRHGAWPHERLVEWAERQDRELDDVAARTTLPHSPDVHRLDALCVRLVESMAHAE